LPSRDRYEQDAQKCRSSFDKAQDEREEGLKSLEDFRSAEPVEA